VMMEAYFDESGIHEGAKVCIVAGFYGTERAWRKFEDQWNKVLADYPELLKGFHAKNFFARDKGNRVGEYKDWSDEKADKFLGRLLQVILRNRVFPIGYGVVVDDFLALSLKLKLWLTGAKFEKRTDKLISGGCPSKSYYLPFQFCVLKSANKSNATPEDKIHFFAGLDRTFYEYATELYSLTLEDERLPAPMRERLGTIAYPLSKETPGIQAADLLANRMYKRALYALDKPESNPTELLMTLTKNWQGQRQLKLLNKDVFIEMERRARAETAKMLA
jgi:hypothetical protein